LKLLNFVTQIAKYRARNEFLAMKRQLLRNLLVMKISPGRATVILLLTFGLIGSLNGCGESSKKPLEVKRPNADPFPSTYQAPLHSPWMITNATVLTGSGARLNGASIVVVDGKVKQVGHEVSAPAGVNVIDGTGMWVTPGLIDVHSHLGVYAAPETENNADGNEMTNPLTAEVWAEHSIWPQDPQFEMALAGGVTTLQILPGSGNLIGGRGVTVKNVASVTVQGMKYPGAPYSLKMACGENPKRVYGERNQAPSTRMGNMAAFRSAWIDAEDYRRKWLDYEEKANEGDKSAKRPKRNLRLETLVGVLDGDIRVHNHCYRADEMAQMIDMSKEFGYKISAFHHSVEAYKLAPQLAKEGICAVMWADWWGFKQEAFDMTRENIALVDAAKACAVIHSDDPISGQHLNQEIAKAMSAGNLLGLNISREHAIAWATLNAAKALGIESDTGSLESGKSADIVLWNGDPFSVYSRAQKVWIDGVQRYDRDNKKLRPTADFNLGMVQRKPLNTAKNESAAQIKQGE
jgi:imidazolonepropionase-like amidohydrolase